MGKITIALDAMRHSVMVIEWAREVILEGEWDDPPVFGVVPAPEPEPLLLPEPEPSSEPELPPEPLYSVKIIASSLNVRSTPKITDNKVGLLSAGDIVGVFSTEQGPTYLWLRISPMEEPPEWVAASWCQQM